MDLVAGGYVWRNNAGKSFTRMADVGTVVAADFDNDGFADLFSWSRMKLYHNDGRFAFSDTTAAAGLAELPPTYQAAWADFNHDGQLDLVAGGKLFVNQGGPNAWLEVHLIGDGRVVNRSAIGAQVRVKLEVKTLTRQVEAGTGEGNQNDLVLHFGLGSLRGRVVLEVFWPNGQVQNVRHVATRRVLEVRFKARRAPRRKPA